MSIPKAQFITLEGVEGAGKSTQKQALCRLLGANGIPYIETREPGGTPYAESIRELLLSHSEDAPSAKTELLLMFAARAQHLETKILPALEAGTWVVCDRFTDATYAYQGGGRQLPVDWIETLETLVQGAQRPDLTLIFDVPVEIGLARAGRRGALDRIESEDIAFFERVRAMYQHIASRDTERVVTLDASADVETVTESMIKLLMTRWNLSCHPG
jgi:dTMP kinase